MFKQRYWMTTFFPNLVLTIIFFEVICTAFILTAYLYSSNQPNSTNLSGCDNQNNFGQLKKGTIKTLT